MAHCPTKKKQYMNLKKSLIIGILLSLIGLVLWESFWLQQGKYADFDRNKALWAVQRAKVENANPNDVVLIGSSRVLFDIQLNEWEKETGIRPIQLAIPGSTPLPVFHDLVNNSDFKGTILVGVTPSLFFSTVSDKKGSWKSSQSKVDYYYEQTYAQRINHQLSIPLQKNLAFISEKKGIDGINLKALLNHIKIGKRVKNDKPPFPSFSDIDIDRNVKMTIKTSQDTAFANIIKRKWSYKSTDTTPPKNIDKKGVLEFFRKDAKKFKKKGGNLILLRSPSTGYYRNKENNFYSRPEFWDILLKKNDAKGYHFEDYKAFKYLDCPEWSHLSAKDAQFFTTELVKIMKADGELSN